ncbi:glucose 1-dehydrogenase [Terrabacter carboxydivorans]|uniref:Glucose 1-dehydrogenase n=1 Tax=Terrabacter carboxydivorans TaxID=619730 RepID=A0ABN3KRX9_9MICO
MTHTALITGGGRGIGRAIAIALAGAGATVVVGDIRDDDASETVARVEAAGGQAMAVRLDVTDSDSVRTAVETVRRALSSVDILVNNAGWDRLQPFMDTEEEFWRRVVEVNYLGVLRVTHALLPAMIENRWGRIVNIGSDSARVGSAMESVYSGAKGAVLSFTKTLAREMAREGITVNAVCPGPTETPLLTEILEGQQRGADIVTAITRSVPMKRLAQPTEIAAAVSFLCSAEAGFVTGQTLSVNGGLTMC